MLITVFGNLNTKNSIFFLKNYFIQVKSKNLTKTTLQIHPGFQNKNKAHLIFVGLILHS